MRLARVASATGDGFAVFRDGRWLGVESYEDLTLTGEDFGPDPEFLAPVEPRIVLGMMHNTSPEERALPPQAFMKAARSVTGPQREIVVESRWGNTIGEGELALVIGKECRNLTLENAHEAVLGWCIGNDVTCLGQGALDSTLVQAKCGDGFTPLGPWIETELDPDNVAIRVRLNGAEVAASSTARLGWSPLESLVHFSNHMTLGRGDVILTGCPGTAHELPQGARVEIEIDGIGCLENTVRVI